MNSEADRFWNDMAPKYRAHRGLCPMTPEEADAEYDGATAIPISDSDIKAIVDAATSGNLPAWTPDQEHWQSDLDTQTVEEEMLVMFREEGETSEETDAIEEELRKRMLNDERPEEQDGLDGGTPPPG
ncbi:MAG: hypothetical protein IT422_16680 [Pirellulaceae bacterium]|nr:hypothetical protein [Pirellulaceae bacterium]